MADQRTYHLLPDDKCLTEQQLFTYIDGKMTASEMHLAEKHLLDCDMCSDALEGFQLIKNRDKVAAFFPAQLSDKKEEKENEPKVIPIRPNRRSLYAIAAAIVLLLGITVVMRMSLSDKNEAKIAEHVSNDSSEAAIVDEEKKSPEVKDSISSRVAIDNLNEQKNAAGKDDAQTGPKSIENKAPVPPKFKQASDFEDAKAVGKSSSISVPTDNRMDADIAQPVIQKDVVAYDKLEDKTTGTDDESKTTDLYYAKPDTDKPNNSQEEVAKNEKKNSNSGRAHGNADAKDNIAQTAPAASNGEKSSVGGVVSKPAMAQNDTTSVSTSNSGTVATESVNQNVVAQTTYDKGLQLLQSGKALDAIASFDQVLQNPNDKNFENAQWQKALALIQLNRIDEAKVLLNEIVTKKGKYKKDAADKLKTL